MRIGPSVDRDELLYTHRHTRPDARIVTARDRVVDVGRALSRVLDVEEAERVQFLVELLDAREEEIEQVDRFQLARAHTLGELPRVAFPQLGHVYPRSVASLVISANASSIPPASSSRSPL